MAFALTLLLAPRSNQSGTDNQSTLISTTAARISDSGGCCDFITYQAHTKRETRNARLSDIEHFFEVGFYCPGSVSVTVSLLSSTASSVGSAVLSKAESVVSIPSFSAQGLSSAASTLLIMES